MNDQTKLTVYEIHPDASDGWALRPASHKRTWMETNGNPTTDFEDKRN